LGLLKDDKLMVLSEQKVINYYDYKKEDNSLMSIPMDPKVLKKATAYYQVADYLYQNDGLKLKDNE
jgi:hypothetical protein